MHVQCCYEYCVSKLLHIMVNIFLSIVIVTEFLDKINKLHISHNHTVDPVTYVCGFMCVCVCTYAHDFFIVVKEWYADNRFTHN